MQSVWRVVHLERWPLSTKIRCSLVYFLYTYIGSSLRELHIVYMDNCILKYLKASCPNLRLLALHASDYRFCNFALLPSSLTSLLINHDGVDSEWCYPYNWYTSFTHDHFPYLERLTIEQAPDANPAITQIATLKTIRKLELWSLRKGLSSSAFTALMGMTNLECLWLTKVDKLPANFAKEIVRNLRTLKQLSLIELDHILRGSHVKMLAQLPQLDTLMLCSTSERGVMEALLEVIPSMPRLKRVEFDDDNYHDYLIDMSSPKDFTDILADLMKCRPDVSFHFRGYECDGNLDYLRTEFDV